MDEVLLGRVERFGRELVESRDVDPIYPVLRALYAARGLSRAQELWQTSLYLAYYNLPSALAYFRRCPDPQHALGDGARYPCAVERRGLRGGKVLTHLADVAGRTFAGDPAAWISRGWGIDWLRNYDLFWDRAQEVWGNGRWAAFKWAELLKKVHGFNLTAPDMRLALCSGPKQGLCELYELPEDAPVPVLDRAAEDLRLRLARRGLSVEDWEELETVLCNYHSFAHGKYYVGHDIDELQAQIEAASEAGWLDVRDYADLYDARRDALPWGYLGEKNGWVGLRTGDRREAGGGH